MNKSRIALFCLSLLPTCLPAFAVAESPSGLALSIDTLTDTESPAGDRAEKYGPGFGLEYSRTLWPRLEVFFGAGGHRLRVEEAGSKSNLGFFELNLGARQYLFARAIDSWSPFLEVALADAWLRDPDSTVGGNRRFSGWKAGLGVGKLLTPATELRLVVAYQDLSAKETRNHFTDRLSAAGFRLAVATRF